MINFPDFPAFNKSSLIFSPIPEDKVIIMNNINAEARTGDKEVPKNNPNILTGEASAQSSVITITNQDQEIITEIETIPSTTPVPATTATPNPQNNAQNNQPKANSEIKNLTSLIKLITLSIFRR